MTVLDLLADGQWATEAELVSRSRLKLGSVRNQLARFVQNGYVKKMTYPDEVAFFQITEAGKAE